LLGGRDAAQLVRRDLGGELGLGGEEGRLAREGRVEQNL
jgi:hypothetical protein